MLNISRAICLGFYDVLANSAFRHEDGVLDLMSPPPCHHQELGLAVIYTVHRILKKQPLGILVIPSANDRERSSKFFH